MYSHFVYYNIFIPAACLTLLKGTLFTTETFLLFTKLIKKLKITQSIIQNNPFFIETKSSRMKYQEI